MSGKKIRKATHDGVIKIGKLSIACAVLEDGTRVLTQETFLIAIGRAGKAKAGTGSRSMVETVDGLPPFLHAGNLKPFISEDLQESTTPVIYQTIRGQRAHGYSADLLPKVCEVYLKARDDDALIKSQLKIAQACDIMMRGLAHVGIIALVDEATGYQYERAREALEKILEQFIAKELFKWVKTFPDAFYQELFRLRDWRYSLNSIKRPAVVGKLTNDLVYQRLAPGVLDELKNLNPKTPKGKRKYHHHRWLTRDFGHPRLREHLAAVVALMKASAKWDDFKRIINRALPKYGDLPLIEDAERRAKERDEAAL